MKGFFVRAVRAEEQQTPIKMESMERLQFNTGNQK